MKTKRCPKCGQIKRLSEFYKHKRNKDGKTSFCKSCCNARSTRYRENNPEKVRASRKRYRENNPEKIKADLKKGRDELYPSYVKSLIRNQTGLNKEQITPDMIELKRQNLKLKRLLKEK